MRLIEEFRPLFQNYVVFTKSIFFMLGLILSYKLVENSVLSVLITHLTDAWGEDQYDLRKAAMVVNLQEGMGSVSVVFFVYLADVRTGRFNMVVFATAFSIVGLWLNFLASRNEYDGKVSLGLLYLGLGLLTFAQAALSETLEAFLEDQLRLTGVDEDLRIGRKKFWWKLVSFVAAIVSLFGLSLLEFGILTLVLAAVMWVCFIVFLLGSNYYHHEETIENQFKDVGIVLARAYTNRSFHSDTEIPPHVPWLRRLDRAVIAHGTETNSCTAAQVETVKYLFKMLPMWCCFLALSLVAASGSTFFFEEANPLANDSVAENDNSILILANVVRFTSWMGSESSSYFIKKLGERMKFKQQNMGLVKIGVGMSCCMPCCLVAWGLISNRRSGVTQFILLGLMQGLSLDGLESFYKSRVPGSLLSFGLPFGELVMGIGKFMSILCILIFSMTSFRWFAKDIDASRLDKNDPWPLQSVDVEMGLDVEQSDAQLEDVVSPSVESGCDEAGDATADRSEIGEEGEADDVTADGKEAAAETHEDPLLGLSDQSTRNPTVNIHALLRAVTVISRLSSRVARKRTNSKNE
ncbi:protein NRT1/ PTR FAMILY 5.6-like [Salvia hispanica]|uniref:protein NRT1/ PTR FAMILY 5.6-like n=1 Tax=Salvia hispanica TaxID=49212 RepID=UPI0020094C88|nr:protein NRT1/ PTR FAMILY 5.6-like [Salvia hispanica]